MMMAGPGSKCRKHSAQELVSLESEWPLSFKAANDSLLLLVPNGFLVSRDKLIYLFVEARVHSLLVLGVQPYNSALVASSSGR